MVTVRYMVMMMMIMEVYCIRSFVHTVAVAANGAPGLSTKLLSGEGGLVRLISSPSSPAAAALPSSFVLYSLSCSSGIHPTWGNSLDRGESSHGERRGARYVTLPVDCC